MEDKQVSADELKRVLAADTDTIGTDDSPALCNASDGSSGHSAATIGSESAVESARNRCL